MDKNYYTYILECSDKSYYTGVTNNLEKRLWEHNHGLKTKCYTFNRRPVVVVYSEIFQEISFAINREKQIKGWSRKKKEALISGNFHLLPKLSKGGSTDSP